MKITCHSCGAKYTVSDEKVQGKTVKMKCRKCSATIVVAAQADGSAGDDAALHGSGSADGALDGPPPGSFLVSVSDADQRTMSLAEVVEAYNSGVITAETYVFADGMNDWQALSENEAIVAALNEAAVATAAYGGGVAAPASSNGGYAQPAPQAAYSPSPYAAPAAAYAAPAASPSSPQAAARRDSRKSGDLFGSGGSSFGSEPAAGFSANALASSSSVGSSPGKRDENSVLFSLNALTAGAPPPARSSGTTASKEDSGLIDLRALSANAAPAQAPMQTAAMPMMDSVGLFPLGAPVLAPPAASPVSYGAPIGEPKKSSKLGLIAGGIVGIAAIAAVFVFVSKGDTKPTPSSTAAADATTSAPVLAQATVSAPPVESSLASLEGSASTDASASVSVAAGGPRPGWRGGPRPPPGGKTAATGATTTPATTTAKPAVGKGSACGCKPGDFNCEIKCSMKKK